MGGALRPGMMAAGFLAREAGQAGRWEFDGFAPVATAGAAMPGFGVSLALSELYEGVLDG